MKPAHMGTLENIWRFLQRRYANKDNRVKILAFIFPSQLSEKKVNEVKSWVHWWPCHFDFPANPFIWLKLSFKLPCNSEVEPIFVERIFWVSLASWRLFAEITWCLRISQVQYYFDRFMNATNTKSKIVMEKDIPPLILVVYWIERCSFRNAMNLNFGIYQVVLLLNQHFLSRMPSVAYGLHHRGYLLSYVFADAVRAKSSKTWPEVAVPTNQLSLLQRGSGSRPEVWQRSGRSCIVFYIYPEEVARCVTGVGGVTLPYLW